MGKTGQQTRRKQHGGVYHGVLRFDDPTGV